MRQRLELRSRCGLACHECGAPSPLASTTVEVVRVDMNRDGYIAFDCLACGGHVETPAPAAVLDLLVETVG